MRETLNTFFIQLTELALRMDFVRCCDRLASTRPSVSTRIHRPTNVSAHNLSVDSTQNKRTVEKTTYTHSLCVLTFDWSGSSRKCAVCHCFIRIVWSGYCFRGCCNFINNANRSEQQQRQQRQPAAHTREKKLTVAFQGLHCRLRHQSASTPTPFIVCTRARNSKWKIIGEDIIFIVAHTAHTHTLTLAAAFSLRWLALVRCSILLRNYRISRRFMQTQKQKFQLTVVSVVHWRIMCIWRCWTPYARLNSFAQATMENTYNILSMRLRSAYERYLSIECDWVECIMQPQIESKMQ